LTADEGNPEPASDVRLPAPPGFEREYLTGLRERAKRAFGDLSLADVQARYRAIVGPQNSSDALVAEALAAFQAGQVPEPDQLAALEAAIRALRPALLTSRGAVPDLPEEARPPFPEWPAFQAAFRSLAFAVGRLDLLPEDSLATPESMGTGFLVTPRIVVTNRHVVWALSRGTGQLAPGRAVIRLGAEAGVVPDMLPIPIQRIIAAHPDADIALLETTTPAEHPGLTLSKVLPAAGTAVVAIGYPFPDSERNPAYVNVVFRQPFGVKRAAPGEILMASDSAVFHDCSTLGGNSGSPILSCATGSVVALHCRGSFLSRNEAIPATRVADFLTT
jgi:S1-C subfamily serine protease